MRDAVLASASTTEVCVARKRARGLESQRSRRHACRALCHAFVGVSAPCRARFCCVLAPIGFLPFSARGGPRFAAGVVSCGCGLPRLVFLRVSGANTEICCRLHRSNREIRVKSRKTGFLIERFRDPNFWLFSSPRAGRHRSPLEKHPWPHALTRVPLVV